MTALARLGILDWGIGGVGVLRALRARTAGVPVLYFSDSGFQPYGLLSRAALRQRVKALLRYLVEAGATSVAVACNAASTVLADLEAQGALEVPTLGMIAPALAQVPITFRGTLGVLGGERTIRSQIYRRGLEQPGRRIVQRIAQPLSAHIEAGSADSQRCARELDRIFSPLRAADSILLACTHYPAILDLLRARAPHARFIDPAASVVDCLLGQFPLPRARAADCVLTTGNARHTRQAAARAWRVDLGPCVGVRV
jgi:glutamate racemase